MDNNINFTGAFLIERPSKVIRQEILNVLGSKRQIFRNIYKKGDIFYVVRNGKDKDVAEFIKRNDLKFKYYPELSTKSGFDTDHPEKVIPIIEEKSSVVIKNVEKMMKLFLPTRPAKKADKFAKRVMAVLKFDENEFFAKNKYGQVTLYDNQNRVRAHISPTSENGINYVYVAPVYHDDKPLRYAINSNGEIVGRYSTLTGTKLFYKGFNNAVIYNKK